MLLLIKEDNTLPWLVCISIVVFIALIILLIIKTSEPGSGNDFNNDDDFPFGAL